MLASSMHASDIQLSVINNRLPRLGNVIPQMIPRKIKTEEELRIVSWRLSAQSCLQSSFGRLKKAFAARVGPR